MSSQVPVSVIEQVSTALSLRSIEHRVIATNIANRDTQGYQRLRLQFDAAMGGTSEARLVADPEQIVVPLEQDMVSLSTNSVQYQGLARVLSRYFTMLGAITNPNRG
jgi:flagellar basal body rod protein FlgB